MIEELNNFAYNPFAIGGTIVRSFVVIDPTGIITMESKLSLDPCLFLTQITDSNYAYLI